MSWIVVDVEADGPSPGLYSMVCFGAVLVDPEGKLDKTFYGQTRPINPDTWDEDALAVSGFTRAQHETFDDPKPVMQAFENWLKRVSTGRPVFISDNPGFDFAYINYYFHRFLGRNPFGWSSRRIGDLYCGMLKNPFAKWKHLRKTEHDHNPVNDAKGNAEALIAMAEMGLDIPKWGG